jgi:hypothetical protein
VDSSSAPTAVDPDGTLLWQNALASGFTALILAITFLSEINMFFLGSIRKYVGRVYEEAKGRPHYVVRKVISARQHRLSAAASA